MVNYAYSTSIRPSMEDEWVNTASHQYDLPIASVIIPNWNGATFLTGCLLSLERQIVKDFEVIVVDNNSTDMSVEIIQADFPLVNIVKLDSNQGFAYAVNRGIETSNAKYVVLLNNDTVVHENWLHALVQHMERHDDIGFCSSRLINMACPQLLDGVWDCFTLSGLPYRVGYGEAEENSYQQVRSISGACAAAAIYRRNALDKVGFLDEEYFAYIEDVDLSLRLFIAGIPGNYVPTAIVYHYGGGTSGGESSPLVMKLSTRNALWSIVKNFPILLVGPSLLLAAIRWMLWCLKLSLVHKKLDYMKAYGAAVYSFLSSLRITLNKRAVVQSVRHVRLLQFLGGMIRNSEDIRRSRKMVLRK